MKPSSDKPMADRSKVSNESVPMSEKKGQFGESISPMGIDTNGAASGVSQSGPSYESSYQGGIGKGDGGPTIDKMGPDNPGKGL
jgi:hypothetical protein